MALMLIAGGKEEGDRNLGQIILHKRDKRGEKMRQGK